MVSPGAVCLVVQLQQKARVEADSVCWDKALEPGEVSNSLARAFSYRARADN